MNCILYNSKVISVSGVQTKIKSYRDVLDEYETAGYNV